MLKARSPVCPTLPCQFMFNRRGTRLLWDKEMLIYPGAEDDIRSLTPSTLWKWAPYVPLQHPSPDCPWPQQKCPSPPDAPLKNTSHPQHRCCSLQCVTSWCLLARSVGAVHGREGALHFPTALNMAVWLRWQKALYTLLFSAPWDCQRHNPCWKTLLATNKLMTTEENSHVFPMGHYSIFCC